jgi:hypothetical protein
MNRCGRLAQAVTAELLVIQARHFDMNINAIQQRPEDALLIFGAVEGAQVQGLRESAVIAAGTGV